VLPGGAGDNGAVKNNVKTAALLAALGGLCVLIGGVWGRNGMFIGLFIGLMMTGGSYWFSDKLAIAAARAQEVGPADAPRYHQVVEELARRAEIPKPRLYIAPNPQPNAFATGRSPHHAAVCINEGLMEYLTWEEISGVLAHELSHVRNRDILTQSVAAAVGMTVTFLARFAMFGALFGGNDRERGGGGFEALAMVILAPIAATLIQMAISRSREFEADASAARLLGDGEPLARALEKLEMGTARVPVNVNPAMENAYIMNPFKGQGGFRTLFSTHPSTADRVARLRSREWQSVF
jgi:heat shock protein HtpX